MAFRFVRIRVSLTYGGLRILRPRANLGAEPILRESEPSFHLKSGKHRLRLTRDTD